jgi:hypothetical protein
MEADYRPMRHVAAIFPENFEAREKIGKTFGAAAGTLQGVEADYRQARLTRAQRVTARWAA